MGSDRDRSLAQAKAAKRGKGNDYPAAVPSERSRPLERSVHFLRCAAPYGAVKAVIVSVTLKTMGIRFYSRAWQQMLAGKGPKANVRKGQDLSGRLPIADGGVTATLLRD